MFGATVPVLAIEPPTSRGALPRAAAKQPPYPFRALNAADSVRLYRSVNPGCAIPVGGRSFSPAELEELGRALHDVAPMLRCPNHPARYVARIDVGLETDDHGVCTGPSTALGSSMRARSFFTLTDRAKLPQVRGTTIHEVIHNALQDHDPRTCTNHPGRQSPLVAEWVKRMGWDATGSFIERPLRGEVPPTHHATKNALEDMAESIELYLTDPRALYAKSRTRYQFAANLIAQLRAMPAVADQH